VDGEDFDYKSLEKTGLNNRKYSIEHSLSKMLETLKQYISECDRLSFSNKPYNGLRYYLVKPYVKDEFFYILDETIDNISRIYKINFGVENRPLAVKKDGFRSVESIRKQNLRDMLNEIHEIECSTDFVSEIEDSISFARDIQLVAYKKL
ncbi:MAG: hypothetical protein QXL94_01940, partial [Candidatus Parvarchaeum sp.]